MRTKGAISRKETKRKNHMIRLTNRQHALIMLLANGTHHSRAQIMRHYIEEGLAKDHDLIEKIKCKSIYNIYKPNLLEDKNKNNNRTSPNDKMIHNLSAAEEERALDYLVFLDSQVDKKPVIGTKK